MYRPNTDHQQQPLFSSLDDLPDKVRERLENSWAETFYHEFFYRIDEDLFADLYSATYSRPNVPVNVLVGLEVLKAGFGWSDQELYDAFCYNVQVRYALGYRDLSAGHFDLRTVYNFRRRVTDHMQATGENLIETVFEQVTDEQLQALEVQTGQLRMDSTQVSSNIRQMSRLQLLVEVLQRVERMLSEADKAQYAELLEPYMKGSSGQVVYRTKPEQATDRLVALGQVMAELVAELGPNYADESAYQLLLRVFAEHFTVTDEQVQPVEAKDVSAASLQSPDDPEATYRKKKGEGHQGYVTNVTETCHPDNDVQLIVKVQTAPNTTDDAALLEEALPELTDRMEVEEMHTDGGYNSPTVDDTLQAHAVDLTQTAIRGRQPDPDTLSLSDFAWEMDEDHHPQRVTCPQGQTVEVTPGQADARFIARFDATLCQGCPLLDQCPTRPLERTAERSLRMSKQDINVALRRQRCQAAKDGPNRRSAVEATVRSLKHPFRQGKLPVRGHARVSIVMVASAVMVNVRRIWRAQQPDPRQNDPCGPAVDRLSAQLGDAFSRISAWLGQMLNFHEANSGVAHARP